VTVATLVQFGKGKGRNGETKMGVDFDGNWCIGACLGQKLTTVDFWRQTSL